MQDICWSKILHVPKWNHLQGFNEDIFYLLSDGPAAYQFFFISNFFSLLLMLKIPLHSKFQILYWTNFLTEFLKKKHLLIVKKNKS